MKQVVVAMVYFLLSQAPTFTQVDPVNRYVDYPLSLNIQQKDHFTKVPFEIVEGAIVVQATVEGQAGSFILDTGAPTLILNGHQQRGSSQKAYSSFGTLNIQTVRVQHFEWAGIEKSGVEAIALDISQLEETYQRKLLGVIGYQIFSDREILIDAANMQIIIFNQNNNILHRVATPVTTLSFELEGHLPVIRTNVGNTQLLLGFDSGCTANLLDEKSVELLSGNYEITDFREVQGFDQQIRKAPVLQTTEIQVPGMPHLDMKYLVTDLSHLQESDLQINGLLGYPFFKQLTFSINYAKRKLNIWKIHNQEELLP